MARSGSILPGILALGLVLTVIMFTPAGSVIIDQTRTITQTIVETIDPTPQAPPVGGPLDYDLAIYDQGRFDCMADTDTVSFYVLGDYFNVTKENMTSSSQGRRLSYHHTNMSASLGDILIVEVQTIPQGWVGYGAWLVDADDVTYTISDNTICP